MLIALSMLLAAACLLPATAKLIGHPKMRSSAEHFGIPWSRYRLLPGPNATTRLGQPTDTVYRLDS